MRIATWVLAVAGLLTISATGWSAEPGYRGPIIDVHLHAYRLDPRFEERTPNPATGKPLSVSTEEEHRRATLEELKRLNIVKGVVSNGTGPPDVVARWAKAAPTVVLPSVGFDDPATVDVSWLRKECLAGRFAAMGEIGAQYEGLSLAGSQFEPLLAMAEEFDIPVGIHTGLGPPGTPFHGHPKFRLSFGRPFLLEEVLVHHPKLRVYMMHAGWPYLEETKAILHMYPQVYVDVGVIDWVLPREEFHSYLESLVRAGFVDRIMFGSDQMVWPEAIAMAVAGVDSAPFLTAEQKHRIFYENARRFFRLEKSLP